MATGHIAFENPWNEALLRAIDELKELRDYVHASHASDQRVDVANRDYFALYQLESAPLDEAESAIADSEMLVHHLLAVVAEMEPLDIRDTLIDHMRYNLSAYLHEGKAAASYHLTNNILECVLTRFEECCAEQHSHTRHFLNRSVIKPVREYRAIADNTAEAFCQQIYAIQQAGDVIMASIKTPYQLCEMHWLKEHPNPFANDNGVPSEAELEIKRRATQLLFYFLEGFCGERPENACPKCFGFLK